MSGQDQDRCVTMLPSALSQSPSDSKHSTVQQSRKKRGRQIVHGKMERMSKIMILREEKNRDDICSE